MPPTNSIKQSHAAQTGFNPFEPTQCQDPYTVYSRVRQESPIFFSPVLNMWVVTQQKEICEILRDPVRFSSRRTLERVSQPPQEIREILSQGYPNVPNLVDNDPPDHTRIRRLCNKAFTLKRVAAMESRIRELTNTLVDQFDQEGRADLMRQFASPLPRMVIADIVGVPREDIDKFGYWAEGWMTFLFSSNLSLEKQRHCAKCLVKLHQYDAEMIEKRRKDPQDDLLTDLIRAKDEDGSSLTMTDLVKTVNSFLVAGHLTTSNLIGNCMVMLLEHPDTLKDFYDDPGLSPKIVEEVLRRDAPVPGMIRVATEDVTINGVTIPKDSRVYLLYASANHDEDLFENPMHFDIHRPNLNHHLALGHGIHFCIGAPLARLEGRVALEVLIQRLANLRFQKDFVVEYVPNLALRGPSHLNLEWDP